MVSTTINVIGIIGQLYAGKSTAIDVAREYATVVGMGDIVLEEIRTKALMPNAETRNQIAKSLQRKHGKDVIIQKIIRKIKKLEEPTIVLEGIRSSHEIELISDKFNFIPVAIVAPKESRNTWRVNRQREDDGTSRARIHQPAKRGEDSGLEEIIANANYVIENTGTIQELKEKCHATIKQVLKDLEKDK